VDYEPVAGYIQDGMMTGKGQLEVDRIPAWTRRQEHERELAHTGLRREDVRVIDRMGEGTGTM